MNTPQIAGPDVVDLAEMIPSRYFTPEELMAVHARVLDVARATLDEDGRAAVELFVRGLSQQDAAAALGWSTTKMSRVLHGSTPGSNSGKKSALARLKDALRADATFKGIYQALRRNPDRSGALVREPPPDAVVTDWFLSTVRPPKPGLFAPLAVLLVADRLADRKRELRYEDLMSFVPGFILSQSLGPLQVTGYIRTDGVTIRILKTPVDDIKAAARPSPRVMSSEFISGIITDMEKEK